MNRTIRRQAGFSIISLMIASAIGIFLMGGAGKIYLDSKSAFNARSAVSTATEGARFSVQDLRRNLVMAGRGVLEQNDNAAVYALADNNLRTFPCLDIDGTDAASSACIIDVDSNDSSAIAVRYAVGPQPCGQDGLPLDEVTHTVRFYITDDAELMCQDIETTGGALTVVYERPLVSGIVRMRALYGVDTDADGIANQYLTATEVQNAGRWINVVTIRVGLITSSDTEELPYAYQPATADDLKIMGMTMTAPNTTQSFKTANATISLRNLNTTVQRQ
ncbi:MAG: PilW family protein [Candidatus Thiodiazotropha sp.]